MNPETDPPPTPHKPEEQLGDRLGAIARVTRAAVVLCVDESVATCLGVRTSAGGARLVAASPSQEACRKLVAAGLDVLFLPIRFLNPFKQAQNAVNKALQLEKFVAGDRVVCSIGSQATGRGDFIVTMEAGMSSATLSLRELTRQTEGVRAPVLEAAIAVAGEIARAARRGKRLGAIFVLGDSESVLRQTRQLVPNPFERLDTPERSLLNPTLQDMLVELAKLDGAFVARGDGLLRTAGAFLATDPAQVRLPQGLGTRHLAAASITVHTSATAVVVSATDGQVRVFSGGELILQMDPESF